MRKERPEFADLYPAGCHTCKECGEANFAGEYFPLDLRMFEHGRFCPDCKSKVEEIQKRQQAEIYALGEEEPSDTDEITCPWCGSEWSDSWEAEDSDDECECEDCGNIFSYERHYEITYSSSRVEKD